MKEEQIRSHIEKGYIGQCSIYVYENQKGDINNTKEVLAAENVRCRISFSSAPPAEAGKYADVNQKIVLFLPPEVSLKAGSKITVEQWGKKQTYWCAGEPKVYRMHQEAELLRLDKA